MAPSRWWRNLNLDPFTAHRLLSRIPSSRASPPMPKPKSQTYTLSVQRRETTSASRWREIASWPVITTETDMLGPLNCGLRENYRIVITQSDSNRPFSTEDTSHDPGSASNPGGGPGPSSG